MFSKKQVITFDEVLESAYSSLQQTPEQLPIRYARRTYKEYEIETHIIENLNETHFSQTEHDDDQARNQQIESFLNDLMPSQQEKMTIIVAKESNLQDPSYAQKVKKLEYYLSNIKLLSKSIRVEDLQNLKDAKPSKELLFGGSALVCYVAGSMKQISQEYLYKKSIEWHQLRHLLIQQLLKIMEYLRDIQQKIVDNKIRPQNSLSCKKYLDLIGKISVFDYQAVKPIETHLGKRLADLAYYCVNFFDRFKELQSLNLKRSKSRGVVGHSSARAVHKTKFNTTFNNDTVNSSLENIEVFTYASRDDITKQLKELEQSIKQKKESIKRIQQYTQADKDSFRSKSQGEMVSDRSRSKRSAKPKTLDDETQVKRIKEQFKKQNKTRYFLSPNKVKYESSRSFSLERNNVSLHSKLLQAERKINTLVNSNQRAIKKQIDSIRSHQQNGVRDNPKPINGKPSEYSSRIKRQAASPPPKRESGVLPIRHMKQSSMMEQPSFKRLNKTEIAKEKPSRAQHRI